MEHAATLSLEQIRAFLEASAEVRFQAHNRRELYEWVNQTLSQQDYRRLGREGKGLIRRYVAKMTGLSRAQVARLIGCYQQGGQVIVRAYRRHRFPQRYTRADIELLAQVDEAHETLSGPATRRILEREFREYGKPEFRRLAAISNGHLYNLRRTPRYRQRLQNYQKTRPSPVSIGERRRPDPQGQPGYLRVDTVHQGDDLDGSKGVYHINAVDEITQWEVLGATPQISEAWLIPVLEAMLAQFPFAIRGFHSDCGSEFINHTVAKLLNKLLIEQTKSRPRRQRFGGSEKRGGGTQTHGALAHCRRARGSDRGILPRVFHSVSQLSPALWS